MSSAPSRKWNPLLSFTLIAVLGFVMAAPPSARAHEVRPGYLELNALGDGAWDVLWKVPAKGDLRLGLYIHFPEGCEETPVIARRAGTAHLERWRVTCADNLVGQRITIAGLESTRTDVLARVKHEDDTTQTVRLTPKEISFEVKAAPSRLEVASTYLSLGVEHIGLGVDHLLFVLALLFLVGTPRKLFGAITAFTVAHSLTLAAATLGWVYVPAAPVEAVIALSILLLAVEALRKGRGELTLAERYPWLIAFTFGLVHGLGFAGALSEIGIPQNEVPLALLMFNVGVETGQVLFVVTVSLLLAGLHRVNPHSSRLVGRTVPYAIGGVAAFWTIQRVGSFW